MKSKTLNALDHKCFKFNTVRYYRLTFLQVIVTFIANRFIVSANEKNKLRTPLE